MDINPCGDKNIFIYELLLNLNKYVFYEKWDVNILKIIKIIKRIYDNFKRLNSIIFIIYMIIH